MSITLTKAAAKHISQTIANETNTLGIRLKVKESGCSGYAYVTELAKQIHEEDVVFVDKKIKIIVDKQSLTYLQGTEIDYKATGINWALIFNNPNAEMHCGCGESFNLKKTNK